MERTIRNVVIHIPDSRPELGDNQAVVREIERGLRCVQAVRKVLHIEEDTEGHVTSSNAGLIDAGDSYGVGTMLLTAYIGDAGGQVHE